MPNASKPFPGPAIASNARKKPNKASLKPPNSFCLISSSQRRQKKASQTKKRPLSGPIFKEVKWRESEEAHFGAVPGS
jgi:hypothetical protein